MTINIITINYPIMTASYDKDKRKYLVSYKTIDKFCETSRGNFFLVQYFKGFSSSKKLQQVIKNDISIFDFLFNTENRVFKSIIKIDRKTIEKEKENFSLEEFSKYIPEKDVFLKDFPNAENVDEILLKMKIY